MNEGEVEAELPKTTMIGHLRNWFLTGVVITAPIGLTIYLIYAFIDSVDQIFVDLLPEAYLPQTYLPVPIPGLGLMFVVITLTLVGFLTANILGRALLNYTERLVRRMPIVRGIYGAFKQIFETLFAKSSKSFRQVALVEFPTPGLWALAFVTTEKSGEIAQRMGSDIVSLFVPTAPNPTSGYLIYAKREKVVMLAMGVDEAMRVVVSGGVAEVSTLPADHPDLKASRI